MLEARFARRGVFSPNGRTNHGLAQLNHYPLGAMESFVLKADRGRAVHADQALGLDYWVERNWNSDEDQSVHRYAEAADRLRASWLQDPELAELHARAVAWRHARFDALLRQEPFRALFGRLLMTPPSRLIPPEAARFMARHAVAPRAETGEDTGA